jgi:hypothetical protein
MEQRKHAILFAATLLCARKLIETMESDKPNAISVSLISGPVHCQQVKNPCTLLESGFRLTTQDSTDGIAPSALAVGNAVEHWG